MLTLDQATIRFGGLTAVDHVSFTVEKGQIFGLIGPNGAGKTTLFNLISGVYKPTSGSISFQGKRSAGWNPSASRRQVLPVLTRISICSAT